MKGRLNRNSDACGGIHKKHHPTHLLTMHVTNNGFDQADDITLSHRELCHIALIGLVSCQALLYASTI